MKKILSILFIFTIMTCSCSQGENLLRNDSEQSEINLDTGYTVKQYNLKKTEHDNGNQKRYDNYDDDDDMPVNFTSPLQLLKQYPPNKY